jgi:hypothetical protein
MSRIAAETSRDGYALAYREARMGLEDQERSVVELRALHLIERDLALHMGTSAELNRRQLRTLMGVFRVGALLLLVEVLAWVVALVVQR